MTSKLAEIDMEAVKKVPKIICEFDDIGTRFRVEVKKWIER